MSNYKSQFKAPAADEVSFWVRPTSAFPFVFRTFAPLGQALYTTVVRNGKRKVISNYNEAGPNKLWAAEALIDSLLSKVRWRDDEIEKIKKKMKEEQ